MKKLLFISIIFLMSGTCYSQFVKPTGTVLVPTYSIYRNAADSSITINQGPVNLYNTFVQHFDTIKLSGWVNNRKLLKYRLIGDSILKDGTASNYKLLHKIDSIMALVKYRNDTVVITGYFTNWKALQYRKLNNHDSLSKLDERKYQSLTDTLTWGLGLSQTGHVVKVDTTSASILSRQRALKEYTTKNDSSKYYEKLVNKSTNVTTDGASDVKYPSAKAVKTYADLKVALADSGKTSAGNYVTAKQFNIGLASADTLNVHKAGTQTVTGKKTFSNIAALTTSAESWIGPSSTTGIYFKGGSTGFGTTGPTAKLTIGPNPLAALAAGEMLQLANTGDVFMSVADGTGRSIFGSTAGIGFIGSQSNTSFSMRTNNLARVTVLNSGNVGIWRSTPEAKLDVLNQVYITADAASTAFLDLRADGANNATDIAYISKEDGGNLVISNKNNHVFNGIVIDINGNLGIKTSSPTYPLHVSGTAFVSTSLTTPTINLTTGAAIGKAWLCTDATTGAGNWATFTNTQTFISTWDANANSPTLADGSGTAGYYHNVTTAGTVNLGSGSITYAVGDAVIYNGSIWQKLPKPIITGAALTTVDDTNITLTPGGSPATSLLNAASITAGWTGTLADSRITSASTWNAKESALTFGLGLSRSVNTVIVDTTAVWTPTRASHLSSYPTLNQSTTGTSAKATILATTRAINGVNFDGSAPISVPSNITPSTSGNVMTSNGTAWTSAVIPTLNQSTTGTAGSTVAAVTFTNSGGAAAGTTFNGSTARTIDYSTVGAQVAGSYAPASSSANYIQASPVSTQTANIDIAGTGKFSGTTSGNVNIFGAYSGNGGGMAMFNGDAVLTWQQFGSTGNLNSTGNLKGNTLQSTTSTGTAPLTVASTTLNVNLNADLLDGQHGSYYQAAGSYVAVSDTSTMLGKYARKVSPTFTGTVVLPSTTSIGTITNTELGYVDGVTSAIQTQFSGKVDKETGKHLPDNNFTDADSTAIASLSSNLAAKVALADSVGGAVGHYATGKALQTHTALTTTAHGGIISNTLASTKILVGNGSNVATAVNVSGDATIANTGAVTVSNSAGNMRVNGTLKVLGTTDDSSPDSIITVNAGVFRRSAASLFSLLAGSTSTTTLGTITTGTWNGGVITGQYGGTGVANTGKTITLGGNLTTSGAYASTFTMTGTTGVTFPTTGTLATTAQITGTNSGTNTGDNAVNSNYSSLVTFPGFGTSHTTAAYGDDGRFTDARVSNIAVGTSGNVMTSNGTVWTSAAIPNSHVAATVTTTNGLSISGQEISIQVADATHHGALTDTDWNTFNGKQAAGSYAPASGSTNYIQNQSTSAQTSTIWSGGNAYFGGNNINSFRFVTNFSGGNAGFNLYDGSGVLSFWHNSSVGGTFSKGYFIAPYLQSTVVTGTAPLTVASTTQVDNLNADYLNGHHYSYFQAAGSYVIVNDSSKLYELKSNKVTSISSSSTDVQYPSAKLLYDQLSGKQATGSYLISADIAMKRNLNNHDSLSTLDEKAYASLTGKPDLTVYRQLNNHDSLSTLDERKYRSLTDTVTFSAGIVELGRTVKADTVTVLFSKERAGKVSSYPTLNQSTTGSAAKWTTKRKLFGRYIDGSANMDSVILDTYISSAATWNAKEPGLGNPGTTGYVLSSTTAGVRSWVIPQSGAQGIQGIQGVQGIKGDTGSQGIKGDTGTQGIKGDTGTAGPNNVTTSTTTNGTGFVKGNGSVISFDNSTYLTTTGSAANLTSFPTFNQSTSGNAGTVTVAANTTNATYYPLFTTSATGSLAPQTTAAKLTFNPSTGNLMASIFQLSDRRYKNHIKSLDRNDFWKIAQIDFHKCFMNDDPSNMQHYVVIAQEVKKVLPELVDSSNPDKLIVNYQELLLLKVAQLEQVIKDQNQRIEKLENKNKWRAKQINF